MKVFNFYVNLAEQDFRNAIYIDATALNRLTGNRYSFPLRDTVAIRIYLLDGTDGATTLEAGDVMTFIGKAKATYSDASSDSLFATSSFTKTGDYYEGTVDLNTVEFIAAMEGKDTLTLRMEVAILRAAGTADTVAQFDATGVYDVDTGDEGTPVSAGPITATTEWVQAGYAAKGELAAVVIAPSGASISPDVAGTYRYDGQYNGAASYKETTAVGVRYVWYNSSVPRWTISDAKGAGTSVGGIWGTATDGLVDAAYTPLVAPASGDISSTLTTVDTLAAASEVAAATSETNAAASEAAAGTSETNAAASESAAATSATNAAASETAAGTSETAAGTSETNAAASEVAAASSATNAATSETNASNSATEAANSVANIPVAAATVASDFANPAFGSFLNETSTFTSWGANVGELDPFNKLTLQIRSWDGANLITRVRCRVRTGTYTGTVVADKTIDLVTVEDVATDAVFNFGEIITITGNVWVEFWTDGRSGMPGASGTSTESRRYSTSLTALDDLDPDLPSASTGTAPTLAVDTELDYTSIASTAEARAHLKQKLGIPHVGTVNAYRLVEWQAKLAALRNGSTVTASLAVIGDSWTNAVHRLVKPVKDRLVVDYTDGGPGWVTASEADTVPPDATRVVTGTWTELNSSADSRGVSISQTTSTTIGDTIVWDWTTGTVATHTLHYLVQPTGGTFRYRVAGGAWSSTVDTAGTEAHASIEIAGPGNLEVEIVDGVTAGITFLGDDIRAASGIIVHKLGRSGASAITWSRVEETIWKAGLAAINPAAVAICLGTNDRSGNVVPADYRQQLATVIGRIKDAAPLAEVYLIAAGDNGLEGKTYTMLEYETEARELALEGGRAFTSLYQVLGDYTIGAETLLTRGIYADTVHPSTLGGEMIGRSVVKEGLLP